MREILFRGKDIAGNWHYGVPLVFTEDFVCMTAPHTFNKGVAPETVGQFTGLTDKNDTKIFEGDIVKDESGVVYPVVYALTGFHLKYAPPYSHGFHYDLLPLSNYWHAHGAIIEIIGNIHDNPELLEG